MSKFHFEFKFLSANWLSIPCDLRTHSHVHDSWVCVSISQYQCKEKRNSKKWIMKTESDREKERKKDLCEYTFWCSKTNPVFFLHFNFVNILLHTLFFYPISFALAYVYLCDLKHYQFGAADGCSAAACRLWLCGTINEQTIYEWHQTETVKPFGKKRT